jgi:hypothetical protein
MANALLEPEVPRKHWTRDECRVLGMPTAQDIRLAVEVSDSTLRADLTAKVRQYESVGIPEH